MPFVQAITVFCGNALKGDHLYSIINSVTMPFVQTITVFYDNALKGDHLNSIIDTVTMSFVHAITVYNYYSNYLSDRLNTKHADKMLIFLLLFTTKHYCYCFKK